MTFLLRALLAIVVGVLVALQPVQSGAAAARYSIDVQLDLFGNPLCVTREGPADQRRHDGHEFPSCCTAGCLQSYAWMPVREKAAGWVGRRYEAWKSDFPLTQPQTVTARKNGPGNPRGPPVGQVI